MKRLLFSLLLSGVSTISIYAQQEAKSFEGYFRNPLEGTLLPSANFAETRTNHLHSGVDIKTGGVEGKPLRAAADGYVCRIGIAPGGFGKVLYINHPNGTTTVYAHMQKFTPAIEKYVKAQRYKQKKHAIDIYLDANTFPVAKGDLIGYSGNSGSSAGPHLHYELRDAATQEPLNPVSTGVVKFKDDVAPTIAKLYYIEIDTVGGVPLNSRPRGVEVVRGANNVYALKDTAALDVGPRGYFVLEAIDRKNDTHNTMGIYRVAASIDGEPLFGFRLDRFGFPSTRYVNSLCHYAMQKGARNQFLRLALQENNRLPVYTKMKNRGAVILNDDRRHPVSIEVYDDAGNLSILNFVIRKRQQDRCFHADSDKEGIAVDCRKDFTAQLDGLTVTIPSGALYESLFFRQIKEDDPILKCKNQLFSPVYTIHDAGVPLHKSITISISSGDIPDHLKSGSCLGIVSADGTTISYMGGVYRDGAVSGNVSMFGRYCVVTDSVPPTITPNFNNDQDLRGKGSVSFTLKDDFSGIASFEGTIDGQWIIFESNASRTRITHFFDPEKVAYNGTKHTLELTVTDNKGNAKTLSRNFIR